MHRPPRRRPLSPRTASVAAMVASAALVPACGGRVLTVDVSLVTAICDDAPELSPLTGATKLQIRVFGEGMNALDYQATADTTTGTAEIPSIPAGKNRNLVVEALAIPGDQVVARGETGPLDLTSIEERVQATVWLRRVSAFTSTAKRATPGACSTMAQDRAAHAMALLADGRVLIAGGLRFTGTGGEARVEYLSSVEIYDPRTGEFTAAPSLQIPRAYHTATHVPGTALTVIAGGERPALQDGVSVSESIRLAEIYDESTNEFLPAIQLNHARSRHAAAAGALGGRVVLAGGYTTSGDALNSTEVFDPEAREFRPGPSLLDNRGEPALVAGASGELFVIGGFGGGELVRRTDILVPRSSGVYDLIPIDNMNLAYGRAAPLAAAAGHHILVTGGFARPKEQLPPFDHSLASTELIEVGPRIAGSTSATLSARRGYGGAVGLRDDTVLVAGGGEVDDLGQTRILGSADILSVIEKENQPDDAAVRPSNLPMRAPRERAAMILLGDGSVLITGGVTTDRVSLRSAEVFQPKYRSSPTGAWK